MLPLAAAAQFGDLDPRVAFAAAALGLAGLAALLGEAIEACTLHFGMRRGGLLNALVGSTPQLSIAVWALAGGRLALVKASLTGALLAHLVLALGISMFLGGLRHGTQYFSRERASNAGTLLVLSIIALGVPAMVGRMVPARNSGAVESLSEAVAAVMIGVFLLSQYFHLFWNLEATVAARLGSVPSTPWSARASAALAAAAVVAIVATSGVWVASLDGVLGRSGLSEVFVGMIVVPLISNFAAHHLAVRTAWRNRMDLSLVISTDAGMQIALFVAPLLVFASLALGQPMDLIFSPLELAAMAAAAVVATLVAQDGESNWLEGAMLIAVYLLIGLAFYWWPAA